MRTRQRHQPRDLRPEASFGGGGGRGRGWKEGDRGPDGYGLGAARVARAGATQGLRGLRDPSSTSVLQQVTSLE